VDGRLRDAVPQLCESKTVWPITEHLKPKAGQPCCSASMGGSHACTPSSVTPLHACCRGSFTRSSPTGWGPSRDFVGVPLALVSKNRDVGRATVVVEHLRPHTRSREPCRTQLLEKGLAAQKEVQPGLCPRPSTSLRRCSIRLAQTAPAQAPTPAEVRGVRAGTRSMDQRHS